MTPFWDKVQKSATCWLWIGAKDPKGYGCSWFKGKLRKASRVAWELFNGPIPVGILVCHHCDTPACVNPDHLFLGTYKDNVQDALKKGRPHGPRPENAQAGKLEKWMVEEIRKRTDIPAKVLARMFMISRTAIYHIRGRKTWKSI